MKTILVERGDALRGADEIVATAAEGRGGLLWLEGDPGLGKTELVEASGEIARHGGLFVVRAAGEEERGDEPFWLATRLLAGALDARSDEERDAVLAGAAAPARALLEESGTSAGGPSMVNAMAWAFANVAERGPVALLVDDAHWADTASLQVLRHLSTWLEELPMAVVVARRPEGLGLAAQLLAALRGAATAEHELRPLGPDGVAAVVRATWARQADDALCAACARATGGNPLLLRELLATFRARDIAVERAHDAIATLEASSPALALARLPDDAAPTAEALAILGVDATIPRLAALTGRPEAEVRADLAALEEAGLVEPGPAFAHPLLRATVRARLDGARRAALHAEAADLLDGDGASPAHVAAHLLETEPGASARAVDVLLGAAREAAALAAPECGVPALRRALLEDLAPARRFEVLLALGQAEAAAGAPEAGERFEEAAALAGQPTERAAALEALAEWHGARGRSRESAEAYDQALAAIAGLGLDWERSLQAAKLSVGTLVVELRPAIGSQIDEIANDPPTSPTPGERGLLAMLGWELAVRGEPHDEALRLARIALDEGRLLADETSEGIGVYVCTGVLLICEAFAEELEVLDAALADARARGSVIGFASASYCRGWPNLDLGRVADAVADFELALGAMRHGWEVFAPVAAAGLAFSTLELSGPSAALAVLDLPELEARYADTVMFPHILNAAASAELLAGDYASALAHIERVRELSIATGWLGPGHLTWRLVGAKAAMALGRVDHAAEIVADDRERAERFGAPAAIARSLRGAALLVDGDDRVDTLERALEAVSASGAALQRGWCLYELGAALTAAGDVPRARETLRSCLDGADRMGARTLAGLARAALVAAGGRPRRARLTGPDSLTPAERRVASMAAEGMTNREIAEALWVTVKAVEFNLSRAYAKLAVKRRDELPAALAA